MIGSRKPDSKARLGELLGREKLDAGELEELNDLKRESSLSSGNRRLSYTRREMTERLGLVGLAAGTAGTLIGYSVSRMETNLEENLATERTRRAVLSIETKNNLITIAGRPVAPDDPMREVTQILTMIRKTHPKSSKARSGRTYEEEDMQWLKPILHKAVKHGNAPMILRVAEVYPRFITSSVNLPDEWLTYNLLIDIANYYPGTDAQKKSLLQDLVSRIPAVPGDDKRQR